MSNNTPTIGVLFFCLGNICRSPIAEGYFRHLVEQEGVAQHFDIDSAATSHWEVGNPPHPMSRQVCQRHGITTGGRSRQLEQADLTRFHYLIGMEQDNLDNAFALLRPSAEAKKQFAILRQWDPEGIGPINDPYGYPMPQYEEVFAQVERSCKALLQYLRTTHTI